MHKSRSMGSRNKHSNLQGKNAITATINAINRTITISWVLIVGFSAYF
jgi:hypothetical protein